MKNLRKVWDAGIPVSDGRRAGNIGTYAASFREMTLNNRAKPPLGVLRSATVNGSKARREKKSARSGRAGWRIWFC